MKAANAVFNRNEQNLNPFASINWRASLVPAAAVIPAPRVYTKAVAVKTLVVEFLTSGINPAHALGLPSLPKGGDPHRLGVDRRRNLTPRMPASRRRPYRDDGTQIQGARTNMGGCDVGLRSP